MGDGWDRWDVVREGGREEGLAILRPEEAEKLKRTYPGEQRSRGERTRNFRLPPGSSQLTSRPSQERYRPARGKTSLTSGEQYPYLDTPGREGRLRDLAPVRKRLA
jgi:hypothetical protein